MKPYKCPYCGKQYKRDQRGMSNLQAHIHDKHESEQ